VPSEPVSGCFLGTQISWVPIFVVRSEVLDCVEHRQFFVQELPVVFVFARCLEDFDGKGTCLGRGQEDFDGKSEGKAGF
jgi:hypothetical protein